MMASVSSSASYSSAMECGGRESFNWYCSEPVKPPVPIEEVIPEPTPPSPISPKLSYEEEMLKRFEDVQKRLEDLKRIAIVDPTYENIVNYVSYQLEVQKMASVFADSWKRAQWQNPDLDYSVKYPTNNVGKQEWLKTREADRLETLKELSDAGWGLWFFYSSTCSYCHRMVPSINYINEQGMQVLPVSIDGLPLNGLSMDFVVDAGQAKELDITVTPTVFLVNKNTRMVAPLSYGISSYEEMLRRIHVIVKTKPGENF